ncbi:hypothetical protein D8B26_007591 [Coccidioides posadasii str. Silveira]|uniref:uncharacterized protein n=1 Tax=Coccidioides posadasii (strain RMSCC 757 / Silveira) TaxID=443226 RepID=UPI001BEF1A12|nr:hypothetical protein D8B26_007591 [Coccidioides posadasii str. Silveira]
MVYNILEELFLEREEYVDFLSDEGKGVTRFGDENENEEKEEDEGRAKGSKGGKESFLAMTAAVLFAADVLLVAEYDWEKEAGPSNV